MSIDKFVTNIYTLLKSDSISNYAISKATGIAQSTLSDYAAGKSDISNMKLAQAISLNNYYMEVFTMTKFVDYAHGQLVFEKEGKFLTTIEQAFISDCGTKYQANAVTSDGDIHTIFWDIKQEWLDNPHELTDEEEACDWEKPND